MDYVKHRKTVEDQASPILVIGSRAFEGNFATSSKDWDLIIPHSSLVTFVDRMFRSKKRLDKDFKVLN